MKEDTRTNHGRKRIKERINIKSGKAQKRLIKNVAERGISIDNGRSTSSPLLKYIARVEEKNDKTCKAMIYQGNLFLFGIDGALITAWGLGHDLYKIYESERKKVNKHAAVMAAC